MIASNVDKKEQQMPYREIDDGPLIAQLNARIAGDDATPINIIALAVAEQ